MGSGVYLEGSLSQALGAASYTLNVYGNHDVLFQISNGVIMVRQ